VNANNSIGENQKEEESETACTDRQERGKGPDIKENPPARFGTQKKPKGRLFFGKNLRKEGGKGSEWRKYSSICSKKRHCVMGGETEKRGLMSGCARIKTT